MKSEFRTRFAGDVEGLPDATRYALDVVVTFDGQRAATLTGRQAIRYTNTQTFALDALYLMLWPNEPLQYLGEMRLERVRVAGVEVTPDQFALQAAQDQIVEQGIPLAAVAAAVLFETWRSDLVPGDRFRSDTP